MKKTVAFLLTFILILSCCACGKTTQETTDPTTANSENVTPADVTQQSVSGGDVVISAQGESDLPVLENYTLVAEQTDDKNNFVFVGETADTLAALRRSHVRGR